MGAPPPSSLDADGGVSPAAASSTPAGTYLDVDDAEVNDGADVAFTQSGDSIQAVIEPMSGTASTKPSTLQRALFWNSGIEAQDILALIAEIIPTTTIEETSEIDAPVFLVFGDVAVPSGGSPSIANLATYKSRWFAIRINGPHIRVDPGQDDTNFSWGGNLALDVTEPTDYTWLARIQTMLWKTLADLSQFTDLRVLIGYAGTTGSHTLDGTYTDALNDNLNNDDTIYRFVGIGRVATGGVQRTIAFTVDSLVAAKAT